MMLTLVVWVMKIFIHHDITLHFDYMGQLFHLCHAVEQPRCLENLGQIYSIKAIERHSETVLERKGAYGFEFSHFGSGIYNNAST